MISAPNFWRVRYLVSMGKFDEYEPNTKTVDNLTELLYSIAQDKVISITPLFVTEYKHPNLTKSEIDECYLEMRDNMEIKRWNEQLIRGNKMVENAVKELSKLQKS